MSKNKSAPQAEMMKKNAAKAEGLLKQLANASRLMVLCNLVEGEKTVSELMECLDLSQSALSQHLAKLRGAKLVAAEKRGQKVYYRIISVEAQALLSVLYIMFCKSH